MQPFSLNLGPSGSSRRLCGSISGGPAAAGLLWLCELVWPLGFAPPAKGECFCCSAVVGGQFQRGGWQEGWRDAWLLQHVVWKFVKEFVAPDRAVRRPIDQCVACRWCGRMC